MKTTKKQLPYYINHIDGKIILTKSFIKAAGILGSPEYKEMLQLRAENPTYKLVPKEISKKKGKNSGKNLTIQKMREHIIIREGENSPLLQQFDYLYKFYETHSGRYAKIKSWYLKQYKDEYTDENEDTEASSEAADASAANVLPMSR